MGPQGEQGPMGQQGKAGLGASLALGPVSLTNQAGGSGGSTQYLLACPDGYLGTGIQGRAGNNVNGVQLRCKQIEGLRVTLNGVIPALSSTTTTTAYAGGGGGAGYQWSCPESMVLIGIHGRVGQSGAGVIDMLGVDCTTLGGGGAWSSGMVGYNYSGSVEYGLACKANKMVTGLQGRHGDLVDSIQLRCQ